MFRAGQKVICINTEGASQLQLNGVYTIKDILKAGLWRWRGRVIQTEPVTLYEAPPEGNNIGFHPNRFRPAVDRKTDISIFTKMLKEKKVGQPLQTSNARTAADAEDH